jgi:hypothetical protein
LFPSLIYCRQSKIVLAAALVAGASAFTPIARESVSTSLFNGLGAGGMADTRDPDALAHDDPRKSISAAPSFEEYLKSRDGAAAAPAAAAPAAAAPVAAAPAAAAPVAAAPNAAGLAYGKYDDQLWDGDAKNEIYAAWDPASPRSPTNFNPYETWDGNSPDASGFYPGEGRYKDPARPNVNFQIMMEEREESEQRAANPKPGDVPGCPGCRN